MKILVYGINYYPELTGIGKYSGEMCEWLAAEGNEVEVITAMPYYPEWEIKKTYEKKWWHTEIIHKVKVHRVPLYVPKKVTGKTRILHEISFTLNSLIYWLPVFFKKYDVIISVCPPLQTGLFPVLYKIFRKTVFVFHFQDLQVDMARDLGMIKNKTLIRLLERVEKMLIKNATVVASISEGMKQKLLAKGMRPEQYIDLPNWVDTDFIKPIESENLLKAELGFLPEDRIILYSGTMGNKQGLERIISIAENFRNEKNIYFVLAGDGPVKESLCDLAKQKRLANVKFIALQAYERLPEMLAMADIHLVLQKHQASDSVFPSKLVSILSAGGLAVVTAAPGSTLYDLIKKEQISMLCTSESAQVLSQLILDVLQNDHKLMKMNARKFAVREFDRAKVLKAFVKTLSTFNP